MRALYTQFSLLIGFLSGFEIQTRQAGTLVSIALGAAVVCTVYIVLLLGDYAIHKYLDERASSPASIRILEYSVRGEEADMEFEAETALPSFDETSVKAA